MPTFYIDQDALGIGTLLRAAGYPLIKASEMGFSRYKDEAHLRFAAHNRLTLISFNGNDYEMLHRAWLHWEMQPDHAGIIIPSQEIKADPMAAEIIRFLQQDYTLTGMLYRWTTGSGWRRYDVPSQLI